MRAAVYHGPGDVRVESVPDPRSPGPGGLLLEVVRASICGTDVAEYLHGPHLIPLAARHPASGHSGPMVLGHEILGRVVSVGEDVESLAVGQRVVPGAGIWCGRCEWCLGGQPNLCESYHTVGIHLDGGLAEYVTVPAQMCLPVSDGCADDHAVMAQPLAVGLHAIRRGGVASGQSVGVIGVGGIGAMIVAGCAALGVDPLIAVDLSPERLKGAQALGATHVIDAADQDAGAALRALTGVGVQVAIEASGAPSGLAAALGGVRRGGRVVLVGLQAAPRELDLQKLVLDEVEIVTSMAHVCDVDLPQALAILEQTDLGARMLDRVIDLGDVVSSGIMALATGEAHGKIVVRPAA